MSHGDYTEAERHFQTALSIAESLPSNAPYLDSSLANLATLYDAQHYYALAEAFYRRLLTLREHVLGPSHSDVAQVLERYAALLRTTHPVHSWLPWSAASRMAARAKRIRDSAAPSTTDTTGASSEISSHWWPVDEVQILSDP
jgi:tetratricopeptide (TPR) repeat protein